MYKRHALDLTFESCKALATSSHDITRTIERRKKPFTHIYEKGFENMPQKFEHSKLDIQGDII